MFNTLVDVSHPPQIAMERKTSDGVATLTIEWSEKRLTGATALELVEALEQTAAALRKELNLYHT